MDKTEAIGRILAKPNDLEALSRASEIAVEEGKWNEALSLGGRAVRLRPSAILYRRLGFVTSRLGFAMSTAAYLLASIRLGDDKVLVDKSMSEWLELRKTLLASSAQVSEIYERMTTGTAGQEEVLKRIQSLSTPQARIREYERLLSLRRLHLPLSHHLAAELIQMNRLREALHVSTAALLHEDISLPNLVNIVGNLIKWRRGKEIVPLAQATVNIYPGSAGAWGNLGGAFDLLKRPWESINACQEALRLDPRAVVALNNLGNSWKNAGDPTQAAKAYERALELLRWQDRQIFSNYLLSLQYASGYTREQKAEAHFRYGNLFPDKSPLKGRRPVRGQDRLRVGFVSADFVNHSVAYFLLPLWAQLQERSVDVHAYHNNSMADSVSLELKNRAHVWKDVHALDDEALADMIRQDKLDILVDPAGHTSRNRLAVFGNRSAPVQLTWLGHPNTTGLRQMDYRVTDALCDPQGSETLYTERLYRMQMGVFGVYRPMVNRPDQRESERYAVQLPPATRNGFITFGSCNNLAKITDPVVEAWAAVLTAVQGSKLLIESPGLSQREFKQHTLKRFEAHGIAADRLDLRERDGHRQYLIYNDIDICLDPFPCNGGTTTFDLLWMGLPLVSLEGDSFVSRMGTTLLSNLGRPEWIADSIGQYVEIAVVLSQDVSELASMRMKQRALMEQSPLMNEEQFGEEFEALLWSLATTGVAPGVAP